MVLKIFSDIQSLQEQKNILQNIFLFQENLAVIFMIMTKKISQENYPFPLRLQKNL